MTETSYLLISNWQLLGSALLLLINLLLSWCMGLRLERSLGMASLRMVVQLLLVGYLLQWLFQIPSPPLILTIALIMATVAGIAGVNRIPRRFLGIYRQSILSILVSSGLVCGLSLVLILQVDPWYNPQYLIPLLGMVLGNTLNGISLGLNAFTESLVVHQDEIEALLALGATRWEAAHAQIQNALRTGMIPSINSMVVMGLVSLPGMMTGQILAGAEPSEAVRYQIVIVFMIVSGTALGTLGVVLMAFTRLFTPRHQLRLDRLQMPQ
ncbi:MAG: iron export ABC transporter permease subunit FetB [Synechococcaceae cyanobacterium SM2_3_1]|nr:iron export ABC transporter permease subunit FetB [Synechococcaceae cyanobacterium SM2_3_1]